MTTASPDTDDALSAAAASPLRHEQLGCICIPGSPSGAMNCGLPRADGVEPGDCILSPYGGFGLVSEVDAARGRSLSPGRRQH
jgi:hypothetical protein